mmetsp:Transcript_11602/g.36912  ORF Transcript_11602/g.36912 Transcript_11602/m.36912 type:complete len:313 (-) Transcript_11602:60-998(-)
MSASKAPPETSLTMPAPAATASLATHARRVSTETRRSGWRRRTASTSGTTRRVSVSASIGAAPGRVDSPPMSTMSTPSSTSRSTCASRSSRPPSLNESGVALTTPMIAVLEPRRPSPGSPATTSEHSSADRLPNLIRMSRAGSLSHCPPSRRTTSASGSATCRDEGDSLARRRRRSRSRARSRAGAAGSASRSPGRPPRTRSGPGRSRAVRTVAAVVAPAPPRCASAPGAAPPAPDSIAPPPSRSRTAAGPPPGPVDPSLEEPPLSSRLIDEHTRTTRRRCVEERGRRLDRANPLGDELPRPRQAVTPIPEV